MEASKKIQRSVLDRKISAFQLAMITVAYVAGVRSLATMAEYGFAGLFYYILGALLFLVPTSVISAELATAWPDRGGVYVWVKEALGAQFGFLAIWLQFLTNIVGLPAYLSYIAATSAYIFAPQLAGNPYYLTAVILIIFWASTFASFYGMQAAGWLNTIGFFFGTFIPVGTLIVLGVLWVATGGHSEVTVSLNTFVPHFSSGGGLSHLVLLAGILFSLTGMEVSGAHARDVSNAQKNYPRGILLAVTLVTLVGFGALSIAIVVPRNQISLVAGLMQAFELFFSHFHMHWASPLLAVMIVVGAVGALNSSIIGPSKGLFGSASGGEIPPILTKVNKHGMPTNMLIFQGISFTMIALLFLYMPSVSSSYWLIMAVVSLLYMCMYLLFFVSAIVLRYKQPDRKRPFRVPGKGNWGMWIMALSGIGCALFCILLSFIPPDQFQVGNRLFYELALTIGSLVLVGVGLVIYLLRQPHWAIDVTPLEELPD